MSEDNITKDEDNISKDEDNILKDEDNISKDEDNKYNDKYETVCYLCRRTESKVTKMLKIPHNINICGDCLQNTFDTFGNSGNIFTSPIAGLQLDWMNLDNIQNLSSDNIAGVPDSMRIKKTEPKENASAKKEIKNIPPPHKIKAQLDEYVIGQEHAKKVISVAVFNHYKRIDALFDSDVEVEKSNLLMIGPTGSGKTHLVKTLARQLDVPLAMTDATSLTEAGYIGDDVESVLSKLLQAAGNDVEKAERGIVFIDEIDKIAKKRNTNSRDVSGESVQQSLLRLLEGAEIEVPVGATSKSAMVPLTTINTSRILFICSGAFPDLDRIIKTRLNKQSLIGFKANIEDKADKEENVIHKVIFDDLREYGMIPEFLGRLPILFTLDHMNKELLLKVLFEPRNAIIRQYQKLLEVDNVELKFEEKALKVIAENALEKKTGARALRSIIEEIMLDIMYEIPKDKNIVAVTITKGYVEGNGAPIIETRGNRLEVSHG